MKRLILGVALTDDPVEVHIIQYIDKLIKQHKRLQSHIAKTGEWVADKEDLSTWKPFDFYNYFLLLYREKYKEEFPAQGSSFREYQRIEAFITTNKISKKDYKTFMELAFSRRFNAVNKPSIGSITSATLYEFIMFKNVRNTTPKDLITLDRQLEAEQEESRDLWNASGIKSGMTIGEVLERMGDG